MRLPCWSSVILSPVRIGHFMKAVLLLLVVGVGGMIAAENAAVTFHVQLVRGIEEAKASDPGWKPVSASVNKRLTAGFRWASYWEVSRVALKVAGDQPVRSRLSPDREVEVQLLPSGEYEARMYWKGKLLRKCRHAHEGVCIMGGTRENDESWFVVVEREKRKP